ncbi:unnamed protein product [Ilex paraguariensis]|uniref:DNA/RNA-binding protein Kin17 WH-like domain-containing protein n=1 Tax=Ilex paraguariensis TaxID=185542 RepID=A0ABC8QQ39_9AQUA
MNSTQWTTLTEFVKYLGRSGKCKVDETPKGWFISYIDRDSETLFKENLKNKRIKVDLVDEEKQEREIMKQIERAKQLMTEPNGFDPQPLESQPKLLELENGQKVSLSLGSSSKAVGKEKPESSILVFKDVEEDKKSGKGKDNGKLGKTGNGGGRSALDDLMREQERRKSGVTGRITGCMLESKHVLRVDQEELDTVIPQIGGLVRIVNGAYRGSNARLLAVDTDNFCAKVQIEKGLYDGRVLQAVEYEDICKVV